MAGPSLSLQTADFQLYLGGRYLLESSTSDGYLLEDGSGVLLLDTYTPQLGDPVVFTNPAWTGRVTNVERDHVVQHKVNYLRAVITATNTATAPGGTAPGDFSDVPAGGYYLQEDGIGKLILEDSSGDYLLEGTSFAYRNCQTKQSQNQDGSTSTYGSLETFETGFQAGQTFLLTNSDLGYSAQSFTITNVRIDFLGVNPPTPIYTIEFGDAYQTLQLAGGGVLTRTASVATQQLGVAQPAGVLGYAQVTASQGTYTALTDLTGLAVTVTVGSGRRIRITGWAGQGSSTATDTMLLAIVEDATAIENAHVSAPGTTGGHFGSVVSVVRQPTAGVHTYKLQGQRLTGAGNITMEASATVPAWIMVEDVGT
jgi:hypothetical protein